MSHYKFNDILNVPYPNPEIERDFPDPVLHAAQFAPFAALTGHGAAVEETARLTYGQILLDESQKEVLNRKLCFLKKILSQSPKITVTHFIVDPKKDGGCYQITRGTLKKLSEQENYLLLENNIKIFMKHISELNCELFPDME